MCGRETLALVRGKDKKNKTRERGTFWFLCNTKGSEGRGLHTHTQHADKEKKNTLGRGESHEGKKKREGTKQKRHTTTHTLSHASAATSARCCSTRLVATGIVTDS